MTHIPCTVRRFADGYLPFVTFSILQPPLYVTIDALVDTGSPFTVLSPKDALSTRLPLSRMRSGPTIGLAGYISPSQHRNGSIVFQEGGWQTAQRGGAIHECVGAYEDGQQDIGTGRGHTEPCWDRPFEGQRVELVLQPGREPSLPRNPLTGR